MDHQSKKRHIVQESLRLKDENRIDKELKPFTEIEFNNLIDSAESDSENGRCTSARELKNEVDSWN